MKIEKERIIKIKNRVSSDIIKLTLEQNVYSENNGYVNIIPILLKEFDGDFKNNHQQYHPVMTGNCCDSHYHEYRDYICDGDIEEEGFYQNATWCCSHCYPSSNRAMMTWKNNKVTLLCETSSTKIYRMLKEYYKLSDSENVIKGYISQLIEEEKEKENQSLDKKEGLDFALKIIDKFI